MTYKFDITALGESLIDFVQAKQFEPEMQFIGNPGGAPANLLASASKFGMKCSFIGKVGNDVFGSRIKKEYISSNIDINSMIFSDTEHTTLTFVSLDESGDRNFFFYRDRTADCSLTKDDINIDTIRSSRIFHFGTLSMTAPCSREATLYAIKIAKENNVLVSFDPNYRASLWNSIDDAKEAFACGSALADIIKISDSELHLLSDLEDAEEAALDIIKRFGCKIVVVTMGRDGAICATSTGITLRSAAYEVETVDTTGAGDAFFGAFLSGIIRSGKTLDRLDAADLSAITGMASACGSLSTTKYGAIPAMPSEEEVLALMQRQKT